MARFAENSDFSASLGVISSESLLDDSSVEGRVAFAERLRTHGWGAISLSPSLFARVANWEEIFSRVFSLPREMIEHAGVYRGSQGVSVGYRHDEERRFVECRMTSYSTPSPLYPTLNDYQPCVQEIYTVLCELCEAALQGVARSLSLDERFFTDLTDVCERGRLPPLRRERNKKERESHTHSNSAPQAIDDSASNSSENTVPALSSSLLRICKYTTENNNDNSNDNDNNNNEDNNSSEIESEQESSAVLSQEVKDNKKRGRVSFGAHTDTSFLTLGLVSSTPALQLVDFVSNTWVLPEELLPRHCVVVFVGEFLQVLTRERFAACVHRVDALPPLSARVSCPLLVRERTDVLMNYRSEKYSHPGGDAAAEKLANFDGMSMKMIHKLLELKRKKCFERNGSVEGDWVLSSFPIARMPIEEDQP